MQSPPPGTWQYDGNHKGETNLWQGCAEEDKVVGVGVRIGFMWLRRRTSGIATTNITGIAVFHGGFCKFGGGGGNRVHLARRPLLGLLYQYGMVDECGAVSGMGIGRGNRSIQRKPAPVSLC
jgi:hypothetical protein